MGRTSRGQHILYKHEDRLLGADPDPLPDYIDELAHREISRYKVSAVHAVLLSQKGACTVCTSWRGPSGTGTWIGQIEEGRGSSLLLVDIGDIALLCLLHDDLRDTSHAFKGPDASRKTLQVQAAGAKGFMLTGILSGYLSRMRAASACLFSANQVER